MDSEDVGPPSKGHETPEPSQRYSQTPQRTYSRQFDEHVLKVTLLKSNLVLISSEQIMLLLKDFTAFYI